MNSIEEDGRLLAVALETGWNAQVVRSGGDGALTARFERGQLAEGGLQQDTLPDEIEISIGFRPYEALECNSIYMWTESLATTTADKRNIAIEACNEGILQYAPRFTKPYIDNSGNFYLGAQGLFGDGSNGVKLIDSFLKELAAMWPLVNRMRAISGEHD